MVNRKAGGEAAMPARSGWGVGRVHLDVTRHDAVAVLRVLRAVEPAMKHREAEGGNYHPREAVRRVIGRLAAGLGEPSENEQSEHIRSVQTAVEAAIEQSGVLGELG